MVICFFFFHMLLNGMNLYFAVDREICLHNFGCQVNMASN